MYIPTPFRGLWVLLLCCLPFWVTAQACPISPLLTIGDTLDQTTGELISTPDGGFALVGSSGDFSSGESDFMLIKLDNCQNVMWIKTYGGSASEEGLSVVATLDGGFLMSGKTFSFGAGSTDGLLIKTDGAGNLQWAQSYGDADSDELVFAHQLPDSTFLLAGSSTSFSTGWIDAWVLKVNSNGLVLWSKVYGLNGADTPLDAKIMTNGDIMLVGSRYFIGPSSNSFMARIDSLGNLLWFNEYSFSFHNSGSSLTELPNGDLLVTGHSALFNSPISTVLFRADSAGTMKWSRFYSNNSLMIGSAIVPKANGNIRLIGQIQDSINSYDIMVLETDSTGLLLSSSFYGDSLFDSRRHDWGDAVVQLSNDRLLIAGHSNSWTGNNTDAFLVTIDALGSNPCSQGSHNIISPITIATSNQPIPAIETNVSISGVSAAVVETTQSWPSFEACPLFVDCTTIPTYRKFLSRKDRQEVHDAIEVGQNQLILAGENQDTAFSSFSGGLLVKTNSNGSPLWAKTYSLSDSQTVVFEAITPTPDSNFLITGYLSEASGPNFFNVLVLKVDNMGNIIWQQKINLGGNATARTIRLTPDSGCVIGGEVYTNVNDSELFLFRLNQQGNLVWSRNYGTISKYYMGDLCVNSDSTYTLVASVGALGASKDQVIIKIDSTGSPLWGYQMGFLFGDDAGFGIRQMPDSGWVVVGRMYPNPSVENQSSVIRFDKNGGIIWGKLFGGPGHNVFSEIELTTSGDLVLLGTAGVGSNLDYHLMTLDIQGNQLWSRTIDQSLYEVEPSLVVSTNGAIVVAANPDNPGKEYDLFLSTFTCDGMTTCPTVDTAMAETVLNLVPATILLTVSPLHISLPLNLQVDTIQLNEAPICTTFCPIEDSISVSDSILCEGESATFINHSIGGTVYEWYLNNAVVSTLDTFNQTFSTPGTFTVSLVTFASQCSETLSVTVVVHPTPNADAGPPTYCGAGVIQLGVAAVPGYTYLWTPDTLLDDSSLAQPTIGLPSTPFLQVYTVQVVDSNGCTAEDSILVSNDTVLILPLAYDSVLCGSDSTQLEVIAFSGTPPFIYQWASKPGLGIPTGPSVTVIPPASEVYTVTVTNASGCSSSLEFPVTVLPLPKAAFSYTLSASCDATTAELVNESTGGNSFVWTAGGTSSQENTFSISYPLGQELPVVLEVSSGSGCSDTYSEVLAAQSFEQLVTNPIPNVFSPNGDGVNDVFTLVNDAGLEACTSFIIFDRWGQLIFKSSGKTARWDGRNFSSRKMGEGVYFYVVEINGIVYNGSVQLLD